LRQLRTSARQQDCVLVSPNLIRKSDEPKEAESKIKCFEEKLGLFPVTAETMRMAFADAKQLGNPMIFANAGFLSLTEHGWKEVLAQTFNFLMPHGTS
jgi:hypothetical protein